jgi:hypothetical protein
MARAVESGGQTGALIHGRTLEIRQLNENLPSGNLDEHEFQPESPE